MKNNDPYDPVKCLQEEVDRFKKTNTFTPMEVTGFYIQAAVVLDELARERELTARLKHNLHISDMRCRELRAALELFKCETCNDTGDWQPECDACLSGEGRCRCAELPDEPCPQCSSGPYKIMQDARREALENSI
jgi:hypothetical protein